MGSLFEQEHWKSRCDIYVRAVWKHEHEQPRADRVLKRCSDRPRVCPTHRQCHILKVRTADDKSFLLTSAVEQAINKSPVCTALVFASDSRLARACIPRHQTCTVCAQADPCVVQSHQGSAYSDLVAICTDRVAICSVVKERISWSLHFWAEQLVQFACIIGVPPSDS